jgi:hypothetical protein
MCLATAEISPERSEQGAAPVRAARKDCPTVGQERTTQECDVAEIVRRANIYPCLTSWRCGVSRHVDIRITGVLQCPGRFVTDDADPRRVRHACAAHKFQRQVASERRIVRQGERGNHLKSPAGRGIDSSRRQTCVWQNGPAQPRSRNMSRASTLISPR